MKSIANQYRDLKEGKMSQSNFMRNLRMSMPQYITNVTSFNDAVKILKNKRILTESDPGPKLPQDDNVADIAESYNNPSILNEDDDEETDAMIAKAEKEKEEEEAIKGGFGIYDPLEEDKTDDELNQAFLTFLKNIYAKSPTEKIAQMIADQEAKMGISKEEIPGFEGTRDALNSLSIKEDKDKKETYDKGDLVKYKNFPQGSVETGKVVKDLGDKVVVFHKEDGIEHTISKDKLVEAKKKKEPKSELHPNQIHPQELRMGIRVELEHTDDLDKAKKIALDHLAENPYYYTALKLSGIESPSAPKAKAPKDAPKKAKKKDATELVDKANQMVKVKELKKKLEEVNLNIDGEPNEVVKKAMTYVDGPNANPILKGLSSEIEFQQQGHSPNEALLRYKYWAKLPEEAVEKLKLQFDVDESTDYDEDTGDLFVYRLTPKQSSARNLGASLEMGASKAGKMDAFKEALEKLVREAIAETFDGRDNLDAKNKGLTPDEQKIVDDILETLQEGMFDKSKFMSYLKKGLITASIIGALLGSTQLNFNQKKDIVDTIKTEKSVDQDLENIADARFAIQHYQDRQYKSKIDASDDFDVQQAVKEINRMIKDNETNNPELLKSFGKNYKPQIEKLIKVNFN